MIAPATRLHIRDVARERYHAADLGPETLAAAESVVLAVATGELPATGIAIVTADNGVCGWQELDQPEEEQP